MAYDDLRHAALEWDTIQRARLALGGMVSAFERHERIIPPWLDSDDKEMPGLLQVLMMQEASALRAVKRAASGEEWLERVAGFVEETLGLGPAILCIVGLLPPLPNFANPAKLWKYLGLHVIGGDQGPADTQWPAVATSAESADHTSHVIPRKPVGGHAPKRPTCGPICKKVDCIHDRWSFALKSYAIARVVPSIIKCMESPYRPVYDARKAHTAVTHPEWGTANPKAPKMHYERDAQRYVAKRVWRDIWRAAHGQDCCDRQSSRAVAAQV